MEKSRVFRFKLFLVFSLFLTACADRTYAPVIASSPSGTQLETVFVATSRDKDARGFYGKARSTELDYLKLKVAVPPSHKSGSLKTSFRNPNPKKHFTIARQEDLGAASSFNAGLRHSLNKLPNAQRDITIYVHGYYNSFADSVFRLAQLGHDFDVPGVSIAYSWPSDSTPLGYSHDRDSALFARDGLEKLLRQLPFVNARRVILVGHSLGSLLIMETLRQIEIATPNWSKAHLDGVVLISPDIDLDVFKGQAARMQSWPEPFALFVSKRDRVLDLSAVINGESKRLGRVTDAAELADFPIALVDVSKFSSDGLQPGHFTVGTSPALIALLSNSQELQRAMGQDPAGRTGPIPGTVIRVQKATQLVLSPNVLRKP